MESLLKLLFKESPMFRMAIFGTFLLIGTGSCIYGAALVAVSNETLDWPSVDGQVTSIGDDRIRYWYNWADADYSGTWRVGSYPLDFDFEEVGRDDAIEVFVNPKNGSQSVISQSNRPADYTPLWVGIGCVIVSFLGLWLSSVMKEKHWLFEK